MEPLDLSLAPPRAPREKLAGLDLIMAARTVDKLRAGLPGGNLGAYQIAGFSAVMFDKLGISEEDLREVVARAADDAEVAAWIRERCSPERIASANERIPSRLLGDRIDDPEFAERYPIGKTLPRDLPLVDMLPHDDAASFAK